MPTKGRSLTCRGRCHHILAELRPPGSKEYKIPRGFLFDHVTCANYTTEIVGWVAFTLATQTAAAAIFTACGAAQMGQWAVQKHMRLRKVRCFCFRQLIVKAFGALVCMKIVTVRLEASQDVSLLRPNWSLCRAGLRL